AEDMEGFAVALACRLAGVPCQIIRGISNRAGDRDKAHWQIEPALRAVAKQAKAVLENVD
ncbi:MAG: futalosine hydrolase, partial [Planctomycetia bacterium]|nr:futalosine hydrolase [Planctomycetia bacterium]